MEQATARQRVSDSQDAQGLGAAEVEVLPVHKAWAADVQTKLLRPSGNSRFRAS